MSSEERKLSLIAWIPLLLVGLVVFFVLYGIFIGLSELSVKGVGAAVGIPCCFVCGGLMVGAYALWIKLTEHRRTDEFTDRKGILHTGAGILTGIAYFALVVSVIAIAGCYRITGVQFDAVAQLEAFAYFFVVAVCEEVIFRGVLFRMIDRRFNTAAAFVVSALVFGAAHLTNEGATWWAGLAIAIEAGLMLSAAYKYSGSLWMPIGIHWAWNYVQGNILGFAVSGGNAGQSLFVPEISGPDIITGGAFGAEASIAAVVIGSILSVFFIIAWLRDTRRFA